MIDADSFFAIARRPACHIPACLPDAAAATRAWPPCVPWGGRGCSKEEKALLQLLPEQTEAKREAKTAREIFELPVRVVLVDLISSTS